MRCAAATSRITSYNVCYTKLLRLARIGSDTPRALVTFVIEVPENFTPAEVEQLLARQGYTRLHARSGRHLEVIQDRMRLAVSQRARLIEALEAALRHGRGKLSVHVLDEAGNRNNFV